MLSVISVFGVSALSPNIPENVEEYKEAIYSEFCKAYLSSDSEINDVSIYAVTGDYAICSYSSSDYITEDYFKRYGDYYEKTDKVYKIFPTGLFVAKIDGSEIYSFEEAYNNNITNMDNIALLMQGSRFRIIGNICIAGQPTIYDVAQIQLYVAKLIELGSDFDKRTIDVNDDGKVNVLDAAYLQIKLAKLI